MKTPSLFLLVTVLLANAALGAWSSAPPATAQSGQSYSMGAVHSGNATTVVVVILKDGASVAGNGTGGSPAQMRTISCSYTSTDSGDKSIVYEQQGWSNATGNYVMDTRSTATTTVSKITPTITWTTPAAITYGTALGTTQQNATASVAGTFSYSPISGTKPDAGSRTLTVTFTPTDTTNYRTATKTVTLTVKKAPLTITAVNKTRTYGAANPTFTVTYSGFVNGDTAATALTGAPGFTTSATVASAVGSYTITPTVGTLAAANYAFSFVAGTLTVTKATLTVTAVNTTRIYGSSSPALTVAYSGFKNSETASVLTGAPSLTTVAATASVGTYPITVVAGTLAAANYTFSFVDGTLTVSKATLTVTADDKSKVYGSANPAFTATYSGFINGDTAATALTGAPSFTTEATSTSDVGSYDINASVGTLAAENYAFSFAKGSLTVTVKPVTPTLSVSIAAAPVYSSSTQTLAVTATIAATPMPGAGTVTFQLYNSANSAVGSAVSGNAESATVTKSITIPASQNAASGYCVKASYGGYSPGTGNYSWTASVGTSAAFSIARRPVVFSFSPASFVYTGQTQAIVISTEPAGATFTPTNDSGSAQGRYEATVDATGNYIGSATWKWVIYNPDDPTDGDNDGYPDYLELLLGTNPKTLTGGDTDNATTELKVTKPQ